jgi:hypothetical protein
MIISSEFGERIDLNQLTRELMSRMEKYLGTPLDWVAVPHFNAEHLHVPVSWPPAAESAGNLFVANTTFIGAGTRRADSQGHAGWVDLHGGGEGRARLLRRRRSGDQRDDKHKRHRSGRLGRLVYRRARHAGHLRDHHRRDHQHDCGHRNVFLRRFHGREVPFGIRAMAAQLRMADFSSVAVDRAGNVYVADASNNVIRVARPVQ